MREYVKKKHKNVKEMTKIRKVEMRRDYDRKLRVKRAYLVYICDFQKLDSSHRISSEWQRQCL